MRIVKPSFELLFVPDNDVLLKRLEAAGRTCYKSENHITLGSSEKFVKGIIKSGHHSVLEHENISVRVVCDRGISHEIVRHRICAFSQESTRYCNYTKGKFDSEITVIEPFFFLGPERGNEYARWVQACKDAETHYNSLINYGAKAQEARSVLPNSLKTEVVITTNIREWRHIFKLRCDAPAHPQIRQIMLPLLNVLKSRLNIVFDDLYLKFNDNIKLFFENKLDAVYKS